MTHPTPLPLPRATFFSGEHAETLVIEILKSQPSLAQILSFDLMSPTRQMVAMSFWPAEFLSFQVAADFESRPLPGFTKTAGEFLWDLDTFLQQHLGGDYRAKLVLREQEQYDSAIEQFLFYTVSDPEEIGPLVRHFKPQNCLAVHVDPNDGGTVEQFATVYPAVSRVWVERPTLASLLASLGE